MKSVLKIIISLVLILAGYAIVGLRAFHPYHRVIALTLYLASAVPLVLAYRERMKQFGRQRVILRKKFRAYWPHIVVAIVLALCFKAAWVLVPVEDSILTKMTNAEITSEISQDIKHLGALKANNEALLKNLQYSDIFDKGDLAERDKIFLKEHWRGFLNNSFELELLKDKYRGFYQVDYLDKPTLHSDAFYIALSALAEQYSSALQIARLVGKSDLAGAVINENGAGIPQRSFYKMKLQLTDGDILLQLNAGAAYLQLVKNDIKAGSASVLEKKLKGLYKLLGKSATLLAENPLEFLERSAFVSWFPLQKNISLSMSLIRMTDRDFFITPEAIAVYKSKFEPGDVLLERRNWFMSNVGIPGFWPHVAFFIGTPADIDNYFAGLSMLQGKTPSQYLKNNYPDAFASLEQADKDGYYHSVIEALKSGIIMTSIEHSGSADYLAVLRPLVSKEEKFRAIAKAFSYFGRPYDYNFDFATDNELVCSELVYKAYESAAGLNLSPVQINGRPLLPPNMLAQKFDEWQDSADQRFELVLYLQGNEEKQTFFECTIDEFKKSWQRPKWDIMQE